MAGSTLYYSITFFDFGATLTDAANIQLEQERFVLIDKQLYGLYNVFGNGTIQGWEVQVPPTTTNQDIFVVVTAGIGIINFLAAETLFQSAVHGLPPNSTLYIYANVTGSTPITRIVSFRWSRSDTDTNGILLAQVVTSSNSIVSINNNLRTEISFQSLIEEQIAQHKHRGSPSKIDLTSEVKNKLSGLNIENISADQITTGVLSNKVLPIIDHNDLLNKGQLTHAGLESYVRQFANPNADLMGVISVINLLRHVASMKYKFSDIDQDMINELCFIPGISPDTFIDWDNTTANVSTATHCISGRQGETGETLSVAWDTQTAFESDYSSNNVVIGATVFLQKGDGEVTEIEDFEDVNNGTSIPFFTGATTVVSDNTKVVADTLEQVSGAASGKFTTSQQLRSVFTRTLSTPQDWSTFDHLHVSIQCVFFMHGPIRMYFVDEEGGVSSPFLLLGTNAITSNSDPELDDFEVLDFDITNVVRNAINTIVIYVDNPDSEFEFNIDNINISRSSDYLPQGSIRFRFSTSDPVTFTSVVYESSTPDDSKTRVRVRVSDSELGLDTAVYTPFLVSADSFNLGGKWIEVEVQLISSSDFTQTPSLQSLFLYYFTSSDINGYKVNTETLFKKGTYNNLTITSDPTVTLTSPLAVGNTYFLTNNTIGEIDSNRVPVYGFNGDDLPLSAVQAWNKTNGSLTVGFNSPKSVVKKGKVYLVADTENNRIIEYTVDGDIEAIYSSHQFNVTTASTTKIQKSLTATYNPNLGYLYITFSQLANYSDTVVPTIKLTWSIGSFTLDSTDTLIPTDADEAAIAAGSSGTIRPDFLIIVELSSAHQGQLSGVSGLLLSFISSPVSNYDAVSLTQSIPVYVGNEVYMAGIFLPVFAGYSSSGNIQVANGVAQVSSSPSVPYLFEFSRSTYTKTFKSSIIMFSEQFLGSIYEIDSRTLLVCGLDTSRGTASNVIAGIVRVVQKDTGAVIFIYDSPAAMFPSDGYVDVDGNYVIAESSRSAGGGRIITLNSNGVILNEISGTFTVIRDISELSGDRILVSV